MKEKILFSTFASIISSLLLNMYNIPFQHIPQTRLSVLVDIFRVILWLILKRKKSAENLILIFFLLRYCISISNNLWLEKVECLREFYLFQKIENRHKIQKKKMKKRYKSNFKESTSLISSPNNSFQISIFFFWLSKKEKWIIVKI